MNVRDPFSLPHGIKAIVFDLDGTIYYGDKVIDGANETIMLARTLGLQVFFITNNSTKSREEIYKRLKGMKIDCFLEEIYTSGYAAALYTKQSGLTDIYISGSASLKKEFQDMGIKLSSKETAKTLVIGYNLDYSYESLTDDVEVALHSNVIVACNKERTYPGKDARLYPGCGAMVSAIEWCSSHRADIVIGKPDTYMLSHIMNVHSLENDEILMVGDTYESDITMAVTMGIPSVYVGNEVHKDTICIKSIRALYDILTDRLTHND
ncbi:MAG: HAD-IIA family hydrolase [Candidatus Cloacimonadaceae bacterium]